MKRRDVISLSVAYMLAVSATAVCIGGSFCGTGIRRGDACEAVACEETYFQLSQAIVNYDVEQVRRLVGLPGMDVNKQDWDGESFLQIAAAEGNPDAVKCLLAVPGIDVNRAGKGGQTPLYLAAWNEHVECVKLLLAMPGINTREWNPLSLVTILNDIQGVNLLIQSGAEVVYTSFCKI